MAVLGWEPAPMYPDVRPIPPPTADQSVGHLFLLQGVLVEVMQLNSPLWSLAVEEVFYALAPLLTRLPRRQVAAWAVASGWLYAVGGSKFGPYST